MLFSREINLFYLFLNQFILYSFSCSLYGRWQIKTDFRWINWNNYLEANCILAAIFNHC